MWFVCETRKPLTHVNDKVNVALTDKADLVTKKETFTVADGANKSSGY